MTHPLNAALMGSPALDETILWHEGLGENVGAIVFCTHLIHTDDIIVAGILNECLWDGSVWQ